MRRLEEFVEHIANWSDGHQGQPGLGNQAGNARPVGKLRIVFFDHITFPDVVDNKGERVH